MKSLADLEQKIHLIENASTNRFSDLMKLAELDPSTDFRGLDLSNIDFLDSDLTGYNFKGSNLDGANFSNAKIDGALFDEKQIDQMKMEGYWLGEDKNWQGLSGLDIAYQRIQSCKKNKSPTLDLSELGLDLSLGADIWTKIFELSWLKHLYLGEKKARNKTHGMRVNSDIKKRNKLDTFPDIFYKDPLPQLTELDLSSTKVADISPLSKLKKLTKLDLSSTQIRKISETRHVSLWNEDIANLTNLTELNISNTKVVNISALSKLIKLTKLDLRNTHIRNISDISNLTELIELNISSTEVVNFSALSKLKKLTKLQLNDTEIGYLNDLRDLEYLTELEYLELSNTPVKDIRALENLKNLRKLNLNKTPVSDLTPLKNLINLEALDFSYSLVSDISPLQNLTNLTELLLGSCDIKHAPKAIWFMPSLTKLYLHLATLPDFPSGIDKNLDVENNLEAIREFYRSLENEEEIG